MRKYPRRVSRHDPAGSGGGAPPTEAWGALERGPYLATLAAGERDRVFGLAESAVKPVRAWADAHPSIRPGRIRPLVLTIAAATPFCDLGAIVTIVRLNLWIFALDDVFDEAGLPIEEIRQIGDRCLAVAAGGPLEAGDHLVVRTLHDVRDDLATYPLFATLGLAWTDAVRAMIEGMLREAVWQRRDVEAEDRGLPAYEDYLAGGRASVGAPTHIWTGLIVIGDPSTPDHRQDLGPLVEAAATVVRLSNDLRSAEKEAIEGKVNSIVILTREARRAGLSAAAAGTRAEARIKADITAALRRLDDLTAGPITLTGRPEASIVNIARFVSEFYRAHDFHTFDRNGPPSAGAGEAVHGPAAEAFGV